MEKEKTALPGKLVVKFVLLSLVGVISFLVPVSLNGQSGTVVSILTAQVQVWLAPVMDAIVITIIAFSAFGSLYDHIMKKAGKPLPAWFHDCLSVKPLYIVSKFLTLAFTVMCTFQIGSATLNDAASSMVALGGTLVALAIAISFLLVFLIDSGLMEFVAEITRPVIRPLFKVPSDASLDLLASWLAASDAAVILTQQKYNKGFYSKREAASVMCNFSLVSVPFCMVVAEIGGVGEYFVPMYLLLCFLGIFLGAVMPRIPPLSRIPDEYLVKRPVVEQRNEEGLFRRGLHAGCEVAERFHAGVVWSSGVNTIFSVLLSVMPIAIGWGVIGMFLVEFTPVFEWISFPMGVYLNLLGVEEAFAAAPATLVGFIDMYIPVLILSGVHSLRTRFIITTLSLIQIVYITIVGSVVFQSKVGVDGKDLFIIFLERTVIALPIIVVAANFIVR